MSDLSQILATILDLKEDMGGVRSDVKSIRSTIDERSTRLDRLEKRVSSIELTVKWATGLAIGLYAALIGYFKFKPDV